ncbi:MAG: GTPase [Planctomycetaceae bacterium]
MLTADTIAAPCSAAGAGPRAIVRVSGHDTRSLLERCFQPDDRARWADPRRAMRHVGLARIDGFDAAVAVAVHLWPTGRSYTGEPLAELHLPGSPPLVNALLETLYVAGARPARAGEFTLRAFLAGRLDLLQAEGVLGVIDAEDHLQLQQALGQLAGGISRKLAELREQLLLHLADLEAGLDFVEEDIDFVSRMTLRSQLTEGVARLRELASQSRERMRTTGRPTVVLAGLPNAGKSTLFNALAGREAAIVSPERGTTRDVLLATIDAGGMSFDLIDTAGCDTGVTSIEQAAARLRGDRIGQCDLVVWCSAVDLSQAEQLADSAAQSEFAGSRPMLRLGTKADAPPGVRASAAHDLIISVHERRGLDDLLTIVLGRLAESAEHTGELIGATAARCQESLRGAIAALAAALSALDDGAGDEIIAWELRQGLDALGMICGAVYTDDILDRIFSRFCIGK